MSRLTHPFEHWPRRHRRLVLTVGGVLAPLPLVLGKVFPVLHEDKPGGKSIIDFASAGSVSEANAILAKWRSEGVIDAAKAIQIFDLVYPLIYSSALAGGCVASAGSWRRSGRPQRSQIGIAMAWVAFGGAAFDYVENVGLMIALWDEPTSPFPQVSAVAAAFKFTLSFGALLYALSGPLAWRVRRPTARA